MKNSKNKILKTVVALGFVFTLICPMSINAQIDTPTSPPPDGPVEGPGGDAIPLDGGLSILLLGAAAFGIKKLRENK